MNHIRKFWSNKRASASMSHVTDIAVAILVVAFIFTLSVRVLATSNLTGVDPTVKTVTTLLIPVLGAISIALYFLPKHKGGK